MVLSQQLHHPVRAPPPPHRLLPPLRQAQRRLVVLPRVDGDVAGALVLPQVPETQVAVVPAGNELETFGTEEEGGDCVGVRDHFLDELF